jgi:site-specific DNA recombinase
VDERPHPLRLPPRQRNEAARPRRGARARRQTDLPALRRGQARHHRDRPQARRRSGTGAAQTGLVTKRTAADPRQPRLPRLIRWNDNLHQGLHEPLVDEDTFERARAILARRHEQASLRRGNPTDFLLSGLVRCHHCGRAYVGTSAHGNGGRYTYYTCSTRYKYGPGKCDGDRLPKDRLEDAVLRQLAGIYRDQRLIEQALADAAERSERDQPQLEEALAGCRAEIARTERKLDRYYDAFETGELSAADCHERVHGHHARLETLREQEADLSRRLATDADELPDAAALTELADHLDEVIASESPEQAKELLRLLVKEIRVHNRRRILPIYRVPTAVRAIPRKVELAGLEPATSWVRS